MTIIIPCGAKKVSKKTTADKMYVGSYFKMNLKFALSVAPRSKIFILSAKHGLISLNTVLEPYNLKMGEPGSVSAQTIKKQAEELNLDDKIYALGGSLYVEALRSAGLKVKAITMGLGMGRQMQLLKQNMGRLPAWQ